MHFTGQPCPSFEISPSRSCTRIAMPLTYFHEVSLKYVACLIHLQEHSKTSVPWSRFIWKRSLSESPNPLEMLDRGFWPEKVDLPMSPTSGTARRLGYGIPNVGDRPTELALFTPRGRVVDPSLGPPENVAVSRNGPLESFLKIRIKVVFTRENYWKEDRSFPPSLCPLEGAKTGVGGRDWKSGDGAGSRKSGFELVTLSGNHCFKNAFFLKREMGERRQTNLIP